MAEVPRIGDLELPQDMDFQRREWAVQRVGWFVLAFVVLAALAGLLGKGPLSSTSEQSADRHVRAEFDRFLHYRDPTTLRLIVQPEALSGEELRLSLNHAYLDGIEIQRIMPEPDHEEAGSEQHTFVFRTSDLKEPSRITFHVTPDDIGSLAGELRAGEAAPLMFHQFVYP